MDQPKPRPLTAVFLRARWCSADANLQISEVRAGDDVVTVAGPGLPPLVKGKAYRFLGAWEDHPAHGRQYRYSTAILDVGVGREGVVAYLSLLDGIGENRATRLWEGYGAGAIAAVRDTPATVATARYLPADVAFAASRALQRDAWRERVTLEVYSLLAKRGFQVARVVEESVKLWGQRAAEVIRKNPYALLLKGVTSCGWVRTDKLYLDQGGARDHVKRQALCAVAAVKSNPGDTWHDAKGVACVVRADCGPGADPVRAIRLAVRARMLAVWREGEARYLALPEQARDESRVAELLAGLSRLESAGRRAS